MNDSPASPKFWLKKAYKSILAILPPHQKISVEFIKAHHKILHLNDPQSFSELIQHRKLNFTDRRFSDYANKVEVKNIVGRVLGQEWIIPTLWSGTALPEECPVQPPFVMKANHASGWNAFVHSEDQLDWPALRRLAKDWLETPWHEHLVEPWYNQMEREILFEPLIGDGGDLPDYKFFVFGGKALFIQVDTDRFASHKRAFFNKNWEKQDFSLAFPLDTRDIPPPIHLPELIDAAERLGAPFDFARVDFYDLPSGPKFGEVTFAPGSGYERFSPFRMDVEFGALWRHAISNRNTS